MGYTVLYIAFGIVALWLLGEVLFQYKAQLHWRVVAFAGFVGLVVGVATRNVVVIGLGTAAFAVGQTFVTLAYRSGHDEGWALKRFQDGGARFGFRRSRPEPALRVSEVEPVGAGRVAAGYGETPVPVYHPRALSDETGEQPAYGAAAYRRTEQQSGYGDQAAGYDQAQGGYDAGYPGYGDGYGAGGDRTAAMPGWEQDGYPGGPYPGQDAPGGPDLVDAPTQDPAGYPGRQSPGYPDPLDPGYPGAGYPDANPSEPAYAGAGYPEPGYADSGYADSGYADSGYAGAGYETGSYETGSYDTAGYGAPGYADPGYGEGHFPDPVYGQQSGYGPDPAFGDQGYTPAGGDGYQDGGYPDPGYQGTGYPDPGYGQDQSLGGGGYPASEAPSQPQDGYLDPGPYPSAPQYPEAYTPYDPYGSYGTPPGGVWVPQQQNGEYPPSPPAADQPGYDPYRQ